jgi:2-oxoacid dehydrogenases acyltransferase (catalytic domain)
VGSGLDSIDTPESLSIICFSENLVNDLVIKSAALALRDVPEANAKWNSKSSSTDLGKSIDISVAVATPNGLITPIVTGAEKRGVADINATVKDLATRARDGKFVFLLAAIHVPATFDGTVRTPVVASHPV